MRTYRLLYLFFTFILSSVKAEEQCDASSGDTCSPGKDFNDANIPASSNPVLAYINELGFFIPNDKFISLESVPIYEQVIAKLHEKREDMKRQNLPTDIPEGHTEPMAFEVGVGIPFASRSIDSIISEIHVIIGDIYTKHEYFELARETLESGIKVKNHVMIQSNYGHKLLVLDEYENATKSFLSTIKDVENEELKKLNVTVPESTALQGLTKVIMHDESLVEGGWNWLVNYINGRMETLEKIYENDESEEHKKALIAMHISLFHYHDIVTKDTDAAFDHMKKYSEYRMIDAPIISEEILRNVYKQMRDPVMPLDYYEGLGVKRKTPIFIVGFPRSGSTLLEKMLNSHPLIAGLGEKTVMTSQFHLIRQEFLKAPKDTLGKELKTIGLELLDRLYEQYYKIATSRGIADTAKKPRRLVDKYLGNFANLGLIHILYPNALILHVMREPMDTIFSCHKTILASKVFHNPTLGIWVDSYRAYRAEMDLWEELLPGRITHVKYEDMVQDTPNFLRALIAATGLAWDDEVLNFSKQKFITNTASVNQVNEEVYTHHLYKWKKYEKYMKSEIEQMGDRMKLNIETNLPGYKHGEGV